MSIQAAAGFEPEYVAKVNSVHRTKKNSEIPPFHCYGMRQRNFRPPNMNDELDSILSRMQQLEKELLRALQRKEMEFAYKVREKKVRFYLGGRVAE